MPLRNNYSSGVLLALAGSLLFSTKAVFVKLSYLYGVDALTLLLLRMLFSLPVYLYMVFHLRTRIRRLWIAVDRSYWWGMLLAAFLGYYLSSLLDFLGLKYIDASVERLILFIYPTFIALLTFVFFKERLSRYQLFALLLSYIGLLFVFGRNLQYISLTSDFWKGAILILACAVTFALFLVLNQYLIPRFGVSAFTSLSMTIACALVIAHFLTTLSLADLWSYPWQVYAYALAMALLATVLPSYLVNYAIQQIGATRSAILASVGPISTISLAYWLLHERLSFGQIIGALLIIVGVTAVTVEMRKKSRSHVPKAPGSLTKN